MQRLGAMAVLAILVGCTSGPPPTREERQRDGCRIDGCAGELCTDQDVFSPCIWRAVYVCFHDPDATCGRQADGSCGWDMTPELNACIAAHPDHLPAPGT
ncbi:MAG TPA: hypothetical protein VFK02_16585 [Kofleriaceae bacterium]|nr:hypothetical protein [Kofleriaceae bacterium]